MPKDTIEARLTQVLKDLVSHEINVITDSEWFEELVEDKTRKVIESLEKKHASH